MSLACIHTHTDFCDGKDNIEDCCQSAFNKGMDSIGFSAHSPITGKTGIKSSWNLPDGKLYQYIDEVKAAKKRWEGRLPIYLGLEIDYIHGLMGPADKEYWEMDLDFVIGGLHYLIPSKGEPFTVDNKKEKVIKAIKESYGGDAMAMADDYYKTMAQMIEHGSFDILAHPDVIKKNNSGSSMFNEDGSDYRKLASVIPRLCAEKGILSEVNTGGLNRGRIKDCYPSQWLLDLFCSHGVNMVINADAHKAGELDGHYDIAEKAMVNAGYSHTAIFTGRKEGRVVWKFQTLKIH